MNLTLIGLDIVGASLCLALKTALKGSGAEIEIIGHDPNGERVKRARQLGAIDKSHWNLPASCEDADLVLLDLPLPEIEATLRAIAGYLKEGCVLVDVVPLKRPVLELAERLLPQSVEYIGGHLVSPRLAGAAEPAEGLVQDAVFYLVAPASVTPQALNMVSNLVQAIGATPCYIDAIEHDGIMAATAQLPLLGALAVFGALEGQPGAEELARSYGAELAALAAVLGARQAATSAYELLANTEGVLHWLDRYTQELQKLRNWLAEAGETALEEHIRLACDTLATWAGAEPEPGSNEEAMPSVWRSMFLGSGMSWLRQGSHGRRGSKKES